MGVRDPVWVVLRLLFESVSQIIMGTYFPRITQAGQVASQAPPFSRALTFSTCAAQRIQEKRKRPIDARSEAFDGAAAR
jgi:hypothetical protein